ncbi:MAG: transcriptional regulator [Bacteroidetes bacterium RIFOXYA12_FULL_35_11]|nr:MAG: transcriptional regulator [Bacteroidetes bacterium GWF2_35_48]OFY82054.1 MAG: transcriptional regulator [Bacteroidetes bacterium RIFOXYA12_FULL_35_11]OFY94101.1 MAG: transcriptional regulator [Bacteroidetes bacterium RIFOXYB2_FULL_35_7]OFY97909.1 MAG: transcriptional regulator [Bacteroidetes bacterium RIFOXYC12_FULL_35_7]HBX52018.1 XRE family transcriptional regulator [Bacteroidales bacterium]
MNRFGEKVRKLREEHNLLLRHLASKLDIDSAQLSKIERGERRAKREQVLLIAEIFEVDKEDLLSLWLATKVYEMLKDEDSAQSALKVAEKEITRKKKSR